MVVGGFIVLTAMLLAVVPTCVEIGCDIPWPSLPNIPKIPDLPDALNRALSVGANWTQGFLGEVKVALGILALSPFLFLRYHVYFLTPLGARFLDICAYYNPTAPNQDAIFCVEVKTGNATRDKTQRAKDAWISGLFGFPIYEWNV